MTEFHLHQVLHGYSSGHGQIAASLKLTDRDSELVTRLSDLSGSLSSGLQLDSYLTVYPLPSQTFFALARTWSDQEAPRAGCVLTHTILIPMIKWSALVNVRSVDSLFRNPRQYPEHSFADALEWAVEGVPALSKSIQPDTIASRTFVSRYFGRGVRPIVWFNAADPEEHLWRLLEHLWPRLRSAFSCCTFSLQQRNLQDRPFDLLFAPSAVYSRFTKLSPEHLLEPALEGKAAQTTEPWCQYWADALFSAELGLPSRETDLPIWNELGEDPTAVRKLSLVHELRLRAVHSPIAGVGAIDVVESLAHDPEAAVLLKRIVFSDAIAAAALASPPEEALASLRLIGDRLHRESFRNIANDFERHLASAATQLAVREPEAAIKAGATWLGDSRAGTKSPFAHGITDGLHKVAKNEPSRLLILGSHPEIAEELYRLEPSFAGDYLQLELDGAPRTVAHWLSSTQDDESLRRARNALLPLLPSQNNEELLSALLKDVPNADVKETLNVLSRSGTGFSNPRIRDVVIDRICRSHPDLVKEWVLETSEWSRDVAAIAAAAYPQTRQGFIELLERSNLRSARLAEVLAKMINSQTGTSYWLRELVSKDTKLIGSLLLVGPDMSADIETSITRLLDEVPDPPIGSSAQLLSAVMELEGRAVFPKLLESAIRSAIKTYIKEDTISPAVGSFLQSPHAVSWLKRTPASEITTVVVESCSRHNAVPRAWKWISEAPAALYKRKPPVLPELCDALLRYARRGFTGELQDWLVRVLQRSRSEGEPGLRQILCAKLVRLAFDNVNLPLGRVVAEAFGDVYSVAIQDNNRRPSFWSTLFNTYDWDKGKDLRISLIDAFLRSRWKPGDLAIAATNAGILRKIFKRLRRRSRGDEYIENMLQDLSRRSDTSAGQARRELKALVADPDFYEEWD